ncbi:P-loop containing nucleoside triphosphate hydrolase protein [Cylindrobasidium torrendii FP15055 ss-10]|uniref:p-loop containing nucleoside triphosphate hydrolase protein n=1 Tax=Cylindrobasidium torrendii FP15055 ss-10 TaxID=1314674 RepID=A0A0D7B0S6_9AGAR|nr:P-loop containing nucleoside triphosphate hydrolase protein [Cylindrobasidium torrendii FP15055 ss-10]
MIHVRPISPRGLFRHFWRFSSTVALRPYQEQCLTACTDALRDGASRIGVSLPTGSGKTTVFISLLARLQPPTKQHTRALIIVNSIELARQSADQVEKMFPKWTVEIEQGAKHKASGMADVTVATYQTLLQPDRLAKFDPTKLRAVIIDEAHHAAAPSYRRILSHFDPEIRHPDQKDEDFEDETPPPRTHQPIPVIGFSATFSRHDGLALGSVFQRIVYHRDFLEMIKEQWLCDVRFTSVSANIDLDGVTLNTRTGDFNPTSLAHVINTDTINTLVVRTWLDRAAERKSTLVFCVNIAHVRDLTDVFRGFGIDARCISSKTPAPERRALVAAFRDGQFPVLVNCAILTEGADIPNIDCVVVARPTRSKNVFAQMIGRGMRLSPKTGKTDCRIVDFVDSSNRVTGVVSTPTLFGLDPSTIIQDETLQSLEERALLGPPEPPEFEIPNPKTVTYKDYEDPLSFIKAASKESSGHINQLSRNGWVTVGERKYILECLGKGHIKIEWQEGDRDEKPHYAATYTPQTMDKSTAFALKVSPFMRSRKVLKAAALDDAIRGCDTYATQNVVRGNMGLGLLRSAKWRHAPASQSQKDFVAKRWRVAGEEDHGFDDKMAEKKEKIAKLTKGEAANIITSLKHGGLAAHEKARKQALKVEEKKVKEEHRKSRERVSVGPLPGHSHVETVHSSRV